MNDRTLLQHINDLVQEEKTLRGGTASPGANNDRIQHLEAELDQCWVLLRQRRANREFGKDPEDAALRDVKTVENYLN